MGETQTHTPGPWEAEIPQGTEPPHILYQPNGMVLATLSGDYDLEERDANARLIAAAPALLAAAERVRTDIIGFLHEEWDGNDEGWIALTNALDAAIAEAQP